MRKFIINNQVHVTSGLVFLGEEVGSNVEKWGDHRIERRISL